MSGSSRIARTDAQTATMIPIRSAVVWATRLRAQQQAEAITQQARRKARQLLARADRLARDRAKRAHDAGLRAGRRRLARQVKCLIGQGQSLERDCMPQMVRLAAAMAERLIRRELRIEPEAVKRICRQVLEENHPGDQASLHLAPGDLACVQAVQQSLANALGVRLGLVPDERLGPGECVVSGPFGIVDARFQIQLTQLVACLVGPEEAHD